MDLLFWESEAEGSVLEPGTQLLILRADFLVGTFFYFSGLIYVFLAFSGTRLIHIRMFLVLVQFQVLLFFNFINSGPRPVFSCWFWYGSGVGLVFSAGLIFSFSGFDIILVLLLAGLGLEQVMALTVLLFAEKENTGLGTLGWFARLKKKKAALWLEFRGLTLW